MVSGTRSRCLVGATGAVAISLLSPPSSASAMRPDDRKPDYEAAIAGTQGRHSVEVVPSGEVIVSASPDSPVRILLGGKTFEEIGLPDVVKKNGPGRVSGNTTTFRDPSTKTAIALQPMGGRNLRAVIVAGSQKSPETYPFTLSLPVGFHLELRKNGSVEVVAEADGSAIGSVSVPWAQDKKGTPVKTWFEVQGRNVLIQHISHLSDKVAYPVVADPAFQGDCGNISCTLRLDHAQTKNARDASGIIELAAGACTVIGGPVATIMCSAAIAPQAGILAIAANRFDGNGNCLGIRFSLYTGAFGYPAYPVEVKAGTYNCK